MKITFICDNFFDVSAEIIRTVLVKIFYHLELAMPSRDSLYNTSHLSYPYNGLLLFFDLWRIALIQLLKISSISETCCLCRRYVM